MNIFERAKSIIVTPKTEWVVIENENTTSQQLLTKYLLLLALIPAIASFIGYSFVGISLGKLGHIGGGVGFGLRQAIIAYASSIISTYLAAWVINFLAASFSSEKNFDKAFQLVVYAYTPTMIAGVFLIFPALSVIQLIAGLYGLYILYLGLHPMMRTPEDKKPIYFVVSLLVMIVVSFAISSIFAAIFVTTHMWR